MTEMLAFLTVAFAVYVLYEVFKTVSQPTSESQTHFVATPPTDVQDPANLHLAVGATAAVETAGTATAVAPASATADKLILRNPATEETCPVPTNYRFAKKWVKEALVAEGLLKKVYKNSELTETVNPKVKEALEKFKHLEKYHS